MSGAVAGCLAACRPRRPSLAESDVIHRRDHEPVHALQVAYPVLTPLLSAIGGGFLVHRLTQRRDVENDRRRQRINYLISAYRVIARSAHRDLRGDRAEAFEDALADIVLLGTAEHIALARRPMQDLSATRDAPIDPLLVTLRQGLRAELDLAAMA